MRLIMMLLALAVMGLLVARQLKSPSAEVSPAVVEGASPGVPSVPQRPQDLPRFEQDIQRFVDDAAKKRLPEVD